MARIRGHFEFLRDEVINSELTKGCLLGNFGTEIIDHSEPIRTGVRDGLASWAGLLSKAIAAGQQAGAIRKELDPDQTAQYLLSAWEGTLIQVRAFKSADVVRQLLRSHLRDHSRRLSHRRYQAGAVA